MLPAMVLSFRIPQFEHWTPLLEAISRHYPRHQACGAAHYGLRERWAAAHMGREGADYSYTADGVDVVLDTEADWAPSVEGFHFKTAQQKLFFNAMVGDMDRILDFSDFQTQLDVCLPHRCDFPQQQMEEVAPMLEWCAEAFGADAISFSRDDDDLRVHDDRRWTWARGYVLFRNETDAVFFKLRWIG